MKLMASKQRQIGGAIGFLSLLALCSAACAQSSVTLYGAIDNGFDYTSNMGGHRSYQALSSVKWGSRIGFTGREDLGGNLATVFTIENGFDGYSGKLAQGGLMFGRQVYVGLTGPWGTVTLGRQYDSVANYLGSLASSDQWAGFTGAHPGDYDNVNDLFRANNAVKYASPNWKGFSFNTLYSLGGVAGSAVQNSLLTAGGGYSAGPLTVNVAYMNAWNPATGVYGGTTAPSSGGIWTSPISSPVFSGFASANRLSMIGAASQFTVGAATFGAMYTYTRFNNIVPTSSTPHEGTVHFNNGEVNLKYWFSPALMAAVSYDYTAAPEAHYHQIDAVLDYFLSKRTDIYLLAEGQRAAGTDSRGSVAVAALNGLTPSSTNQQVFVRVGLTQRF
jgi:predicted porin